MMLSYHSVGWSAVGWWESACCRDGCLQENPLCIVTSEHAEPVHSRVDKVATSEGQESGLIFIYLYFKLG